MNEPKYLRWIVEEEGIIENFKGKIKCYRIKYNDDSDVLDDSKTLYFGF